MTDAQLIVTHFSLPERVIRVTPLGEGFINDTYLVDTSEKQQYILQRKNHTIFPNIPGMMENIYKVTSHIREKGGTTFSLIPTKKGKWFHKECTQAEVRGATSGDNNATKELCTYWVCFTFIPDTVSYEHADSLELIRSGGEGVGMFHSQLADFTEPLADTLPGFHNISYRFDQFSRSVERANGGKQRLEKATEYIREIFERKERMMAFWQLVENGTIPKRVSHNDTKLSNFLFDKNGRVVAAIDLDTVMSATVLFDFGDAIRSYTNRFPEDHPQFDEVEMDPERFFAFSGGYLSKAAWFLNDMEKEHLAFSALYITYEQFLRFLMDYIDGDTYYRIRYPSHNLVRARTQWALLKSMEAQYPIMQEIVTKIYNTL